ncbi:malonic semialdehyde reductase [Streptosporangium nondiastaticum]|uniref:Malonic semialdehyde reductase n=1 Tax=Streptosporangium nondiastaticum TaxID=35764 RepID=A0A9X7JN42_9ACTN|nr:malonic semialdehyde reductase [Streptosporangium nondiastaticum]PSJ26810.1 malonic semialdehyde reductase [Streptosporangium nondiastaticum]
MTPPGSALRLDTAAQDLLFRQAHSTHVFTDEPVTDETIQAVYDLVKYGPTAFNQQPLRVVLVRSHEARRKLVGHMARGNREKTARSPLVAILAGDRDFHTELPEQFPRFPEAATRFYADPAVRERSAEFNGALQVAYFIIGLRAAGLAAGPMSGFDAIGINKEFFAESAHFVLAVVNIGWPPEGARHSRGPRLDFEQVFTTA